MNALAFFSKKTEELQKIFYYKTVLFENAFSALNEELREKKGVVSLERKGNIIYLSFSRCKNKEAAACLNRAAQKLKQSQNNALIQKSLLSGRAGKG